MDFYQSAEMPDFIQKAKSIGIVANDAGGAKQIGWLTRILECDITYFATGPAISILGQALPGARLKNSLEEILYEDLLITGSGWMTQIEQQAIEIANIQGLNYITVIDHWLNYQDRFARSNLSIPIRIGTTNDLAFELAEFTFTNSQIVKLPDLELDYYRQFLSKNTQKKSHILVILEPNSKFSSGAEYLIDSGREFEVINFAIDKCRMQGLQEVILRPHPSQNGKLPNDLEFNDKTISIRFSDKDDLLQDLVGASAVIGFGSYALYLSSKVDIETYSYFKGSPKHWVNRFSSILSFA